MSDACALSAPAAATTATPAPACPILALHGLSFQYPQGQRVFDATDFALLPGQQIGLYGPNGSGKTTFFRLVTGLARPSAGEVLLHGQPMRTEEDFRLLRQKVGLVMQNAEDQLFCPTVIEDVAFGPLNMGLRRQEARECAAAALEAVGLRGFDDRLTHRLSGGEKKLVSVATVLVMQPEVLLLDEPTNGLDPEAQERVTHLLQHLPTPRIIISHNWDFLARTSTSFLTISHGKLTDAAPALPHSHLHAHPLGDTPHDH